MVVTAEKGLSQNPRARVVSELSQRAPEYKWLVFLLVQRSQGHLVLGMFFGGGRGTFSTTSSHAEGHMGLPLANRVANSVLENVRPEFGKMMKLSWGVAFPPGIMSFSRWITSFQSKRASQPANPIAPKRGFFFVGFAELRKRSTVLSCPCEKPSLREKFSS